MTAREHPSATPFRAPAIIFWTALALRLASILIGHTYHVRAIADHFNFGFEMGRIARSLALGQGYANPFNGQSGPTAWTPPLYPLLIALAFKLFGIYTSGAAIFLLACNSIFSAAIAPAIYEIAARCFDARGIARRASRQPAPVALWSAWIWAIHPAALQYAIHWIWEMSLSTCLFTWTLVLALRLRGIGDANGPTSPDDPRPAPRPGHTPGHSPVLWAAFGLLWGLLALSNASLLLCLPAILLWIAWPQRLSRTALLRPILGAALASAVLALVMAPWILRNERTLHAFIPTRSNLGIELYQSTLEANAGFPWGTTLPLWTRDPEFQRYVRLGEVRYARLLGDEAKARIRAHPTLILQYTLLRLYFFWDGVPHPLEPHPTQEYLRELSFRFISLCGLLGLALMLRRRAPAAGLFALAFVLVPLPYYLITVQPRFRHPIEPLITILAVYLFRSASTRTSQAGPQELHA